MTILITGAGVIGTLTATLLIERGDTVVIADIHKPETLPHGCHFEICDITEAHALEHLIQSYDVSQIVHTAAMLSTAIRKDPLRGVAVNVMGTANVLDVAKRRNIGRVVCSSSTTVGYSTFGSFRGNSVPEDLPIRLVSERPGSIYAATKIAGEHLALLWTDLYGVDVVVLRYAAVLGGQLDMPSSVPGRLLAVLVKAARHGQPFHLEDPLLMWGGSEDFVDARDCARANLAALDLTSPKQRVYNIAAGSSVDLPSFIAAVKESWPKLDVQFNKIPQTGFAGFPHLRPATTDVSAAKNELGFVCKHSLIESIHYWTNTNKV